MLVVKWCLDLISDVAGWSCDVYMLMVFLVINYLFLIIKNDIFSIISGPKFGHACFPLSIKYKTGPLWQYCIIEKAKKGLNMI
jgi:hypothetical protein